jgi:mannose-6-phosphate isomerase-like protein (cupin superfamily)
MTINQNGLFVEPGQGPSYYLDQNLYTFKAVGEETGGAYTLFEMIIAPGGGSPLHRHNEEDESFYVQEGEIEFQLDDRILVATAGTFIYSPKGQHHRIKNTTSVPAKMLALAMPAGVEKFIAKVGKTVNDQITSAPPLSSEDLDKMLSTAPKYDCEVISLIDLETTRTINQKGLFVEPGKGHSYNFGEDFYTLKASGEETGEAYVLFEAVLAPGGGTPLHRHKEEDESFYVQEGEIEFQLDDRILVATAGTFIYSPKGQIHRITNTTSVPAKMLAWVMPPGVEKTLAKVGKTVNGQITSAPPLTSEDLDKMFSPAPK